MSKATVVESVQEGCRWIHNPPSGGEFAAWFAENVQLHEGLDPGHYVNGITLIPNKERYRETRLAENGEPELVDVERLVFAPYPQVETRTRYFWDWCAQNDLVGEIEILPVRKQSDALPQGIFSNTVVAEGSGKKVVLVGAKAQVRAYVMLRGQRSHSVLLPPPATKMVPLHGKYGPDENAVMKAETGAIGRALGFAGMLVIPGAGISTAEDMEEFLQTTGVPAAGGEPQPTLPPAEEPAAPQEPAEATVEGEALGDTVKRLLGELRGFETEWTQFSAWAKQREIDIENPAPAALRPLERQVRRKLSQARKAAETGEAK